MGWDEAFSILGVAPECSRKEARRAYLRGVKRHPPERDPDGFQEIREAWELIEGSLLDESRPPAPRAHPGPGAPPARMPQPAPEGADPDSSAADPSAVGAEPPGAPRRGPGEDPPPLPGSEPPPADPQGSPPWAAPLHADPEGPLGAEPPSSLSGPAGVDEPPPPLDLPSPEVGWALLNEAVVHLREGRGREAGASAEQIVQRDLSGPEPRELVDLGLSLYAQGFAREAGRLVAALPPWIEGRGGELRGMDDGARLTWILLRELQAVASALDPDLVVVFALAIQRGELDPVDLPPLDWNGGLPAVVERRLKERAPTFGTLLGGSEDGPARARTGPHRGRGLGERIGRIAVAIVVLHLVRVLLETLFKF